MKKKKPARKGVYILPNLLTTASLLCGFMCILWSVQGRWEGAAMLILAGALFDGLDGKVARMTGTSSEFGVQFDSLADMLSFGVAPAVLVYFWKLQPYGRLGMMASFLMVACAALRLARFNVQTATSSKKLFTGLPSPAAGCTIATLVLFSAYLPTSIYEYALGPAALVMTYLVSFLMVSTVRYYAFKEYGFMMEHKFSSLVTALLLFVLIASKPKLLGFVVFFGYILSGFIYTFVVMPRRHPNLLREARQGSGREESEELLSE